MTRWWVSTYRLDVASQAVYRLDFVIQLIIWSLYSLLPFASVAILISRFGSQTRIRE